MKFHDFKYTKIIIFAAITILSIVAVSFFIEMLLHDSFHIFNSELVSHVVNTSVLLVLVAALGYFFYLNKLLRHQDAKLKRSYDNISLITRLNGIGYAVYNLAMRQFMGYDHQGRLISTTFSWEQLMTYIHPHDRELLDKMEIGMLAKEESQFKVECRYKPFGKGEYKWYVIDAALVTSPKDNPFADYLFMFRDNDSWHQAQEGLAYFRKQISLVSDFNGVTFVIYDVARDIFRCLDSSADALSHDIPLSLWVRSFHPDDYGKRDELLAFLRAHQGESYQTQYRYRLPGHSDYTWFDIHVNVSEYDDNHLVARYMCFVLDINTAHNLLADLSLFKEEVTLISSSCRIVFSQYDVGSRTLRFLNDVGTYSSNQRYPWSIVTDSFHPDDMQIAHRLQDFLFEAKERSWSMEYRYKFPDDKEYHWYQVNVIACDFDSNGRITKYIIQGRDNQELHLAMDEMRELRDRAELENRLKTSFLENISHEIRTPLNAVIGFTDLLCDNCVAEKREEYKMIIHQNTNELLQKVEDILTLSMLESGKYKVNRLNFNVSDFFLGIVDSLHGKENKKVVCQNNIALTVKLDPLRLNDVVTALLKNALSFTKEGGQVSVNYASKDEGLYVEVSDNGIGIDEKNQARIFERFEKVSPFSTGTGLGLPICKTIVEQSGGHIGVKSKVGEGSTFWFWIPCEIH
jgi:signal transduction histidine kinase